MFKLSQRVVLSSVAGAVAVGVVTVGGIASATASSEPTLERSSARFVAPSDGAKGSLTFTTEAADDSGVKSLKVLAWPNDSELEPTAEELERAERATCESTGDETSKCTYTLPLSESEAEGMERGEWTVSALLTSEDGEKKFVPEAASFTADF